MIAINRPAEGRIDSVSGSRCRRGLYPAARCAGVPEGTWG